MAVTFDAVGPAGGAGTASATSPLTWSHVNGGNAIVVGVTIFNGSSNTVTACTYGGVALSLLGFTVSGSGGAGGVAMYGLAGGTVPTGTNTVSVSFSDGANHNAGSISFTGAATLGTPVTGIGTNTASVTASVTGTTAGNMIAAACCYGGTALITITGTNSVTTRWEHNGTTNSGADNGAGGTVASAGGTQTVGFTDTGTDFWGIVAVEVQAGGGGPAAGMAQARQQRRGKRAGRRSQAQRQQAQPAFGTPPPAAGVAAVQGTGFLGTAAIQAAGASLTGTGSLAAATNPPCITGLGGTGAGYFADTNANPKMWLGDEIWALLTNAGRWNSGNYQAAFDAYFSTRAAQGFTICYSDMFNSTFIGGATNGQMWNGQTPYTSNNPSSGLNSTYWQVIDYALNSALARGITIALSFGGHWDWDTSGNAMFGFTGTQYQAAGNAIGTRYKNQPNVVWLIMDDYFGSFDSSLSSLLTGLRASGDTHPIAISNYPETSSRFDLSNNSVLSWGTSNTQYNFGYSYGETYLPVEYMYAESSPLTCIYGDGYFYQGTSSYNGGNAENSANAFDHAMRQDAWWAIASGARGWDVGDEALWQWASSAPAAVPTQWFAANNAGNIRTFMEGLAGWYTLAPATGSALITAGRGTRGTQPSSGGGGGQYEIAFTNAYVAASRTPDTGSGSSLAVLYFPTGAAAITVDQTKLVSGYTATWVDPVTCATTSGTAGSTYNPSTPGTNSQGGSDWVLVLQAPAVTTIQGAAALDGAGSLITAVTQGAPAALTGTGRLGTAAVQGAGASLTGAGAVTAAVAQGAPAALTGAGRLGTAAVQGAGASLTGAGAVTAAVAQGAPAALTGAGSLGTLNVTGAPAPLTGAGALSTAATLSAPAVLTGTGSLVTSSAQLAPAVLTGTGSLITAVTQGAVAALTGTGVLTGTVAQGTSLTGTGTLSPAATLLAPAVLTGAGTLVTSGGQLVPAALTASGFLGTAVTQLVPAGLTGTGTLSTAVAQGVTAALTASGFLGTAVTQGAAAALAGAGILSAAAGQGAGLTGTGFLSAPAVQLAPAALTGTGSLITAVTQGVTAALAGTGTLGTAAVLAAPAALTGTGSLTASVGQGSVVTGAGTLNAPAVLAAPASLTGTGFMSTAAGAPGVAALAAAGIIAVAGTLAAPAVLTGTGTLGTAAIQRAGSGLAAAGTLGTAGIQGTAAVLAAAGSLVSAGGPAGAALLAGTGFLAAAGAVSGGAGALLAGTGTLGTAVRLSAIVTLTGAGSLAAAAAQQAGAVLIAAGSLTALGTQHPPQIKGASTDYAVTEPMMSSSYGVGTG